MSSFYTTPYLGPPGQAETWMHNVESTHDIWCSCPNWLAHLLDIAYPADSKARQYTIQQLIQKAKNQIKALPALPSKPWHSDGTEGTAGDPDIDGNGGGGQEDAGPALETINEEELMQLLENAENQEKDDG